ncbi:MAG TPA: 50S ribosomal protein L17 [Patescibacteria group bacterium]|nr:50S ribosomal protein L17 [Patescibacteria group bacterium]
MYKKVYGKKLSRDTDTRQALFRSLIVSLILNGKIETTKTKAKAIQADVDKLFTLVAKDNVANRRLVLSKLANDSVAMEKIFSLKKKTEERKSGFTRITVLPNRRGDNAPMVRMEFV